MEIEWFREHRGLVRVFSVVVPLVVSGGLYLADGLIPTSARALVLALVVVGCAATGDRLAGVLAAFASTVGFDFFLAVPYLELRIFGLEDMAVAGLLLLTGLAVSELASWGIRQSATACQQAGLVKRVLESADLAAGATNLPDALDRVANSIKGLLGAEQVSFKYGDHDPTAAVISRDGTMRYKGRTLDVELTGLPVGPYAYAAIPVVQRGAQVGYFRVSTPKKETRPARAQLRVAVLLAGEWSLRAGTAHPRPRENNRVIAPQVHRPISCRS